MITVIRICRKRPAAGPWRYGSLNSPLYSCVSDHWSFSRCLLIPIPFCFQARSAARWCVCPIRLSSTSLPAAARPDSLSCKNSARALNRVHNSPRCRCSSYAIPAGCHKWGLDRGATALSHSVSNLAFT